MILRSPLLDQIKSIQHGFGTRNEPVPDFTHETWADRPTWKQVHGTEIAHVRQPKQTCGLVDGIVTQIPGLPIAIVTADCVPILFAHRSGRRVAAIHAGWRGTLDKITHKLWKMLLEQGEKPSEWVAAIGPCIGPCCYEVSSDLIDNFKSKFGNVDSDRWNPTHRRLDLASLNLENLKQIGLGEVDCIRACTQCSNSPAFYSFRKGDRDSRQFSAILIQSEKPGVSSSELS